MRNRGQCWQKSSYEPLFHRRDPSHVPRFLRPTNLSKNSFEPGGRMSTEASFQPGRNFDSVRHADRFGLPIDGSDYFRVLREAITRAQRSVIILGWDIDSRMKFTPEGSDDDYADALGDFLHGLLTRADVHDRYCLMSPSVPEIETGCVTCTAN
jgi:hypothetical protein